MARSIKETPILTGADAERFMRIVNAPRKETASRRAQISNAYRAISKMMQSPR